MTPTAGPDVSVPPSDSQGRHVTVWLMTVVGFLNQASWVIANIDGTSMMPIVSHVNMAYPGLVRPRRLARQRPVAEPASSSCPYPQRRSAMILIRVGSESGCEPAAAPMPYDPATGRRQRRSSPALARSRSFRTAGLSSNPPRSGDRRHRISGRLAGNRRYVIQSRTWIEIARPRERHAAVAQPITSWSETKISGW